jgi:hypothetical protein
MMRQFLDHLREASSSPLALMAYLAVLVAWAIVTTKLRRYRLLERKLDSVPRDQRGILLKQEYKVFPKSGLSAEQWLKDRRQTLLFWAFIATLAAVTTIILYVTLGLKGTQTAPGSAPERYVETIPNVKFPTRWNLNESSSTNDSKSSAGTEEWAVTILDRIKRVSEKERISRQVDSQR